MARKIEVQILGDDSSLQRSFRNSAQATDKFGKSLGSKFATAAKIGAAAIGGLTVVSAVAGKRMIGLASNAAEVQSKMEVVFGKTLPGLTKNLDAFSKATGTSRFLLREQVADMGALLEPLTANKQAAANMSEQFVKLATDLGSFNNVPTADALLAIRSGLVGEAEPLRRFGVLLNEAAVKQEALRLGLVKGKEALTEQDKVQARASLIMKQTTLAQGDAIRTADSFANQMKRLKSAVSDTATEIGISLLPVATRLVGFFNDFLQAEGFRAKLNVIWEGVSEVATDLFDKLREAIGAIDWAGVWGEAQGLAESFSTRLQEGFNAIDWGPIGEAIGEGVTKALEASGGQAEQWGEKLRVNIDKVDWRSIGERVGVAITGGVGEGADKESGSVIKRVYTTLTRLWIAESAAFLNVVIGAGGKIMDALGDVIGRGRDKVVGAFDKVAVGAVTGFAKGLTGLGRAVSEKFNAVLAQLGAFAGLAANKAYSIGAGIITGIISGLGGLFSRVADAIISKVRGAIDFARDHLGSTAEEYAAKNLGAPVGEGVIRGWIYSTRDLPEKMASRVKAAIEAGRKAVEAARGRFASAFSTLSSDALSAFDRVTSKMQTPAEKALADFDRRKAVEGMQRNLSDAQAELAAARAEGDNDKIVAAMERVADAETALWRDALEQQAEQERAALDDRNELRRKHFEERLAALEASWAAEGVSASKAHTQLMKLLASFGVDWRKSGKAMGLALAEGIRQAEKAVVAAAASVSNAGRGAVSGGGSASRSLQAVGAGAGPNVNVYVAGSVQAEEDLALTIRDTLARNGVRNDGTGL